MRAHLPHVEADSRQVGVGLVGEVHHEGDGEQAAARTILLLLNHWHLNRQVAVLVHESSIDFAELRAHKGVRRTLQGIDDDQTTSQGRRHEPMEAAIMMGLKSGAR